MFNKSRISYLFIAVYICIFCPRLTQATPSKNIIAVSYFENMSKDESLEPLSRGLAEMLITDLSTSEEIKVVERSRLNDVIAEIKLQENPFFDSKKATKLGQGLGASFIITGSYLKVDGVLRIDARVVRVDDGSVQFAVKAENNSNKFLSLQRDLSEQILEGFGSKLSILAKGNLAKGSTQSYEAFLRYSEALSLLDAEGNEAKAKAFLERAIKIDPNFKIASDMVKKVQRLKKEFNLITMESQIESAKNFIVGAKCECNHLSNSYFQKAIPKTLRRLYPMIHYGPNLEGGYYQLLGYQLEMYNLITLGLNKEVLMFSKEIPEDTNIEIYSGTTPHEQGFRCYMDEHLESCEKLASNAWSNVLFNDDLREVAFVKWGRLAIQQADIESVKRLINQIKNSPSPLKWKYGKKTLLEHLEIKLKLLTNKKRHIAKQQLQSSLPSPKLPRLNPMMTINPYTTYVALPLALLAYYNLEFDKAQSIINNVKGKGGDLEQQLKGLSFTKSIEISSLSEAITDAINDPIKQKELKSLQAMRKKFAEKVREMIKSTAKEPICRKICGKVCTPGFVCFHE